MDKKEKTDGVAGSWFEDLLNKAYQGVSELGSKDAEIVLKRCSESCLKFWLSILQNKFGWDPKNSTLEQFLAAQEAFEKHMSSGKAQITRDGNVIDEKFWDGECTCPLVKKYKLVKPFPNLCLCAQNTFKGVYEAGVGREVKAEVVESYCRGGKCCHLRFEIQGEKDHP